MASIISLIPGCGLSSKRAVNQIENYLNEKYGKEFTVSSIGDRMYRNTATSFVYANDDPSMQFVVMVDSDGKVVYDQYSFRMVCRKVENTINEAFEKEGINSECFIDFNKWIYDLPLDCSIEDYVLNSGADVISAAVICEKKDNISGEELSKVCSTISSEINGVKIAYSIYLITENDFDKVHDTVKKQTKFYDIDLLRLYGANDPVSLTRIKAIDGTTDKSNAEIDEDISKEV